METVPEPFFSQGPYLTDLPRAVSNRIRGEVQRRIAAREAREREKKIARDAEKAKSREIAAREAAPSDPQELKPEPTRRAGRWQDLLAEEHARRRDRLKDLATKRLRATPDIYEALDGGASASSRLR
jgi:hypothetical protein